MMTTKSTSKRDKDIITFEFKSNNPRHIKRVHDAIESCLKEQQKMDEFNSSQIKNAKPSRSVLDLEVIK